MARTKPRSDKVLTIRVPEKDLRRLEAYCILHEKTKTEVIRNLIHKLEVPENDSTLDEAVSESLGVVS